MIERPGPAGPLMARRSLLGLLGGGAAALLGLSGCGSGSRSAFRFRMTVTVTTPVGPRRGASVYEVMARNKAALAPGGTAREWRVTGEALAVDLPGGRTLFALLRSTAAHNDLATLAMAALDPAFRSDFVESAARIAGGDGTHASAPARPSDYPFFVTFGDEADPASVEQVDPANLAARFGAGIALAGIMIERTDDPVTTGLIRRLPWLTAGPELPGTGARLKASNPYDHSLAATLAHGDFIAT